MADKRIYYIVNVSGSSGKILKDLWTNSSIPFDQSNSSYANFLLLSSSNLALALQDGAPIPSGVTSADIHVQPTFMPTGSHP